MRKQMRGMGRYYPRGKGGWFWVAFYHHGREVREPVKPRTTSEAAARQFLKRRLAEVQTNRYIVNEEKVTFEQLVKLIETDYELNRRKSLDTGLRVHLKHLRAYYGFDRALDIEARHDGYKLRRLQEGASVATINRETSTLRRMFSLAHEKRMLSRAPVFKMVEGERIRQGFVSPADFTKLLGLLPEYICPLAEWLYHSGWRKSAALNLEWKEIDMHTRTARLKAEDSKNGEPWTLPLAGRLYEIIQGRAKARRLDCVYVFHDGGKQIGDFRKSWQSACVAAGLGRFVSEPSNQQKEPAGEKKKKRQRKQYEGLLVHDLRRSAARNMSRAGVGEQIAMKVTGHKTQSMFRRYRIVDENEIREALERTQAHVSASQESKISKVNA